MDYQPINIQEKFYKFSSHWFPKIIAQVTDYHIKLAKIQGEFVWHSHPETDEMFFVVDGEMEIHFRDGVLKLHSGEMYVVPKGVEHKPVAVQECQIMLIEPAGTVNTGDQVDEKAATTGVWI